MDATIFRYLIYLAISEGLNLHLMDVVTAYLYGSLGDDIHMKICEGIQMSKATNSKHCGVYSIKQQRSLHWLNNPKACGIHTWMNIWNKKYMCITLLVYAYSLCWIFAIVIVYVEHLNFVGTPEELTRIVDYLKSKFERKYPRKQNFCLDLQIKYFSIEILVYYLTYTTKALKHFHIGKLHPLSSSMIVRSLKVKKNLFH